MCAYIRVQAIKRSKISFFKYRMFNTGNEFGRCWKASRTKIGLWDNSRRQPPPLGLGEQKGKDGCYQILGPQMKRCHGVGVMTVKGCSQLVHRPLGSGGSTWLVLGPLRGHCSLVLGLLRRYCNGWLSNLRGRHCSSDLGFLSQFLEWLVLRSLRGQRPSNPGLFRGYACFPVALKALNWGLLRVMFQYSEEVLHSSCLDFWGGGLAAAVWQTKKCRSWKHLLLLYLLLLKGCLQDLGTGWVSLLPFSCFPVSC